jgi:hypothetical protein
MAKNREIPSFAVCVANEGCDDLTLRKLYRVLRDEAAERSGYWRVVDDSGEDYVYPSDNFLPVKLTPTATRKLLAIEASADA